MEGDFYIFFGIVLIAIAILAVFIIQLALRSWLKKYYMEWEENENGMSQL